MYMGRVRIDSEIGDAAPVIAGPVLAALPNDEHETSTGIATHLPAEVRDKGVNVRTEGRIGRGIERISPIVRRPAGPVRRITENPIAGFTPLRPPLVDLPAQDDERGRGRRQPDYLRRTWCVSAERQTSPVTFDQEAAPTTGR